MPPAAKVSVERRGDVAWVQVDNPPVNATSTEVRVGLLHAVDAVAGARVAILRCTGRSFIAGGDMSEFDAAPVAPHLPDIVQAIEDSEVPFLAVMHGSVLGGGLEIAMGCAWRIAAPGTRFGLPEVNVGLIPGAGGTQRLPRLVGMEPAIDMACLGRVLPAEEMLALGGIDAIAEDGLDTAAEAFLAAGPDRPLAVRRRPLMAYPAEMVETKRAEIAKRAGGQTAPMEALDAVLMALLPFDTAQPRERAKHLELRGSPQSRALRHAFFAERAVANPESLRDVTPPEIETCVVVGGGLMGAGIATALLTAGCTVTVIEQDAASAAAAEARVQGLINGARDRGKASAAQVAERLGRFGVAAEMEAAADADLAIEAVFEDAAVKQAVFARLAGVMRPDALLATNTSYLDPRGIFDGVANLSRCLGLHFFSPAHVMKLVEVIGLPETSQEALAGAFAMARRMRKVPVQAGICDGFIGNRMLAAMRRQADYLLADGALPYQVDSAMRAFGMKMGPYELQDLTGLQIAWANRKRLAATRPTAERYVPIADALCEAGRLGQRSGRGWYLYEDGSRTPLRDTQVEAMIESHSVDRGIARREFVAEEISARMMAVLANEGARIVEEGLAESDQAVDVVQMHGYGFPRWRGGPMCHAAAIGWEETARIVQRVVAQSPGAWVLARRLEP